MVIDMSLYEEVVNPKAPDHAVHGNLLGKPRLLEQMKTFRQRQQSPLERPNIDLPVLISEIRVGSKLTGHKGIVHGGVTALLYDEIFGWGYEVVRADPTIPAFTANLNIDFRNPIPVNFTFRVRVHCKRIQGRKSIFEGIMETMDGSMIFAEATCIMVSVKSRL